MLVPDLVHWHSVELLLIINLSDLGPPQRDTRTGSPCAALFHPRRRGGSWHRVSRRQALGIALLASAPLSIVWPCTVAMAARCPELAWTSETSFMPHLNSAYQAACLWSLNFCVNSAEASCPPVLSALPWPAMRRLPSGGRGSTLEAGICWALEPGGGDVANMPFRTS